MNEQIACIMPTYNRFPSLGRLVCESVESFLRQDYENKLLLIINDTPGQRLRFDHPQVLIFNLPQRLPTLSDKIQFAIDNSKAPVLCRWDDDDISLPRRLSYSAEKLGGQMEWRAENYWFDNAGEGLREVRHPGNTHITGLWRRSVLGKIGGYPQHRSGDEDQQFNQRLAKAGLPARGEVIPISEMFYLYRWGTGSQHLSGDADLFGHWDRIGQRPIEQGEFEIEPRWEMDHLQRAAEEKQLL